MAWRNVLKGARETLVKIHKAKEVIVFDTETTGIGNTAKIIQFSAIKYKVLRDYVLKEIDRMDVYMNPEEKLQDKIVEITGITDEMLKDKPNERILAPEIFSFMESSNLWAAYNCKFDIRMLSLMSQRTGITFQERECIDILQLARDLVKKEDVGDYKLGHVTGYLFPEMKFQFHSAIDDVSATANVFSYFLKEYRKIYDNAMDEEDEKVTAELQYAYYWQNPHRPSQQRICLVLSEGEKGAIFWDTVEKNWNHKSDKLSKELFMRSDLSDLENQFIKRYGYRFHTNDMDTISSELAKIYRQKKKQGA